MTGSRLRLFIVDGYAAQHPGDDSPQATPSAAVHLVVLEAVFSHEMPSDLAILYHPDASRRGRGRAVWEIWMGLHGALIGRWHQKALDELGAR